MGYVREFNITVETVEKFIPSLKDKAENLFYDAKSVVLAFNSKSVCVCYVEYIAYNSLPLQFSSQWLCT